MKKTKTEMVPSYWCAECSNRVRRCIDCKSWFSDNETIYCSANEHYCSECAILEMQEKR